MRNFVVGCWVLVSVSVASAGESALLKDIDVVVRQGRGTPAGRAAWDRLSQADATAVPILLERMPTETAAANWIRTAIDQIVAREKKLDPSKLLTFVQDPTKPGRARRYALDLVERAKPGTSAKLYEGWLDDPEFRYEAVALVLEKAQRTAKTGNNLIAVNLYRQAFAHSRDVQQARDAAAGLLAEKEPRSVAEHLGFLMDWHLIGPFDGKGQKGFHLSYPPETKVDLHEELDGQTGKVRWKRFHVKETASGRNPALVDLRSKEAIGNADDAVAFAYTELHVPKAIEAEMRGSADDNMVVWVNGTKVFAFEEWRNGVRHDRHRFAVQLKEGKNTVLVKISQSAAPNPEPNWEFLLRVVDATGKGIARTK